MMSNVHNGQVANTLTVEKSNPFRAAEREAAVRSKTGSSYSRYIRATASLAGGVSSGLRRSARPYPLYYAEGRGSRLIDVDGNEYIDYTLAWGPLILGHAPREIAEAVSEQARRGMTYGAQHDLEYEVAERLKAAIPCAEAVAFASSGTEIVQVALRLARAATGRTKHIKFEGHYHGWDDSVLVNYHPSGEQIERSDGGPIGVGAGQLASEHVVIAEWNNPDSVRQAFETHRNQIASIICEPLVCNSGSLEPEPGFLEFLREITSEHNALLIFDEVITGFRVALGGAQELFKVVPDLATYAKAVGAGSTLSVLAGKREYMDLIATGKVVHAGTLNGNPLSLAAAKAALDVLSHDNGAVFGRLQQRGDRLRTGLEALCRSAGLPVVTTGRSAVFHLLFTDRVPRTYRDLLQVDTGLQSDFGLALLDEGVLVLPDGRWYVSTAHTDADIEQTLEAARRILA